MEFEGEDSKGEHGVKNVKPVPCRVVGRPLSPLSRATPLTHSWNTHLHITTSLRA